MSRPVRNRARVGNENDENAIGLSSRLRAKTLGLSNENGTGTSNRPGNDNGGNGEGILEKKYINSKNTTNGITTGAPLTRRRAALGDVSNVSKKNDGLDGKSVLNAVATTRSSTVTNPTRASTLRARNGTSTTNSSSTSLNRLNKPASSSSSLSLTSRTSTSTSFKSSTLKSTGNNNDLRSSMNSIANSKVPSSTIHNHLSINNPLEKTGDKLRSSSTSKNTHSLDEPSNLRASKRPKTVSDDNNTGIKAATTIITRSHSRPLAEIPPLEVPVPSKSSSLSKSLPTLASPPQPTTVAPPPVQDWDDLDEEDYEDPLMVSEYVVEIFEHLYKLQHSYLPDPDYMRIQSYCTWKMRGILLDWLVEVHTRFRLLPETLFLAVNIFDRYMSSVDVPGDEIQTIGVTSLFIAAKYEEVFTPSVANFAYMVDSLPEEDILEAERGILKVIEFNISYPNAMNFLRRISKADDYDINTRTIGKYLLEISLFDHRLMKFTPAEHSAAAMLLARKMLNRPPWDRNMKHYSGGYDEVSLKPILALIIDYLVSPVVHDAFFKKYANKRFLKASIIARTWAKENRSQYPISISS